MERVRSGGNAVRGSDSAAGLSAVGGAKVADGRQSRPEQGIGGLAGWLINRVRGKQASPPRLRLLERIVLAPRQSLALIEAEGRRILVATSADGGPAFYALDSGARTGGRSSQLTAAGQATRVSW
jgi:Flagellar biosynthesis protein, FliO